MIDVVAICSHNIYATFLAFQSILFIVIKKPIISKKIITPVVGKLWAAAQLWLDDASCGSYVIRNCELCDVWQSRSSI